MSNQGSGGEACPVAPLVAEPLSMASAVEMAAKFKALADPVRLQFGGQPCRWAGVRV
jgi:ArsR family transcriptional regulator